MSVVTGGAYEFKVKDTVEAVVKDDITIMTKGVDMKVLNNIEISTNAFILKSVEDSLSAFTEGDAALGIDKLWVNAEGKIMVVSADDIDTVSGGNTFVSMAGSAEMFIGNGIDVTSTDMSFGLSEGMSLRAATAEIEGTDAIELVSMGASVKMSR